jgi:hypothetical protein
VLVKTYDLYPRSFESPMKISSASLQPSALDTWLHEAAQPDAASSQATGWVGVTLHGTASGQDSAERLLELKTWDADPSAKRSLRTNAPAPDALMPAAAQLWATHIFAPLV